MKYLLIILISLLPLATKSQDTTIKMSLSTARKVAKDLIACDSVKAVFELTKDQLKLTDNKVEIKDSIIESYKAKCSIYDTIVSNEKKKFDEQNKWIKQVSKDNKSLKVRLIYTKISMGAIIVFLGYLLAK